MKKLRNEKGFAMAELLAVCIIVLGIFAVLFSNYLPLTAEYENRVTYNNVNAEYAATYIRKAFKDVKVYDALKNLDTTGYYTLYTCESGGGCEIKDGIFTKSDGTSRNSEYEKKKNQIIKFINEYGIQEIIITKYKTKEVKDKYKSGLLYNYIKYIPTFKDSKVTKTGKYRIILKTKDYGYATVPLRYAEPNEPKLDSDMLPVYFDSNNKIIVADKTNESVTHEWYDYVQKKWANVVKLSSKKISSYVAGDPVDLSDIQTMWVWIPKYKYKEFTKKSPTQINVTFITQDNSDDTPHPAFEKSTTGFWVGKYEGTTKGIVPGGTVAATSQIKETSVISNQQWGAVGYLAYSRYGTCDSMGEKTVCEGVDKNTTTTAGAGGITSSTTRNWYGVFDMNGGRFERVSGSDNQDKGSGSSNEILHRGSKSYFGFYGVEYDHKFINKNACVDCKYHWVPCRSCGTGENFNPCCSGGYGYYYEDNRHNCEQNTNDVKTYYCNSNTGKYFVKQGSLSTNGSLYYSWNNTMYRDSCLSAGSENLDLRGGSGKGNAWCILTKVPISTPDTKNPVLKRDPAGEKEHYILQFDYEGIFSYSSSKYVDSSYITYRSVIKK